MLREYLSRTSFRRQLMSIVSVAILILALFSTLMNSWEVNRRMQGYLQEQGLHIAENLARQSTLALLYRSPDNASEAVATTLAFPDVLQVEITDAAHHRLLTKSKPGTIMPAQQLPPPGSPLARAILEKETADAWHFGAPVYADQENRSPFELQEHPPQLLGYVHLVLGKSTQHRLVTSLLFGNLVITLSFAIILLGILWLLTRRMTHPLKNLSALMGRAQAGESGMRAIPQGPQDIVKMAASFNQMMAVLEEREIELIQARDGALHAAMMKAQFAATVSHEIRTPLNGVMGMLDMLKEMHLTQPQQECADVAWRSSQTLMELINDILDFSKMEAGKLELEEIEFDLRQLLEDVFELFAQQAQQKGVELGYLLTADVPERIVGDAQRLRQVLNNLVGNAVKFTEQGDVAVCICRAADGDSSEPFGLRFSVSDTGIGMEQTVLKHVFESFSQADRSTTRQYGGTGLGLAISKQLVELMQGAIGADSRPGQGSTFWFTIACKRGVTCSSTAEDLSLLGVRVLIADQSDIVRRFLQQNLSRFGMICHTVHNPVEMIATLKRAESQKLPYALLIMDRSIADAVGSGLNSNIRADATLSSLPLLLLENYRSSHGVTHAGAVSIIKKPLRLVRLLDAIRHLLAGKQRSAATLPLPRPVKAPILANEYRILVVEDNSTNQMVAGGMLAMNGCHCEFAGNGREAVDAARSNRFDLILMDCSMPEMDGYTATAYIRHAEQSLGLHTTIIAMTANTQQGDAEKCLAAGMDDYLAKPITLSALRSKLERWLVPSVPTRHALQQPESESAVPETATTPLDLAYFNKLREILGPALQHSVAFFLEDTPAYLKQLDHAVELGDAASARSIAHSIKGSSANLGAICLSQSAKEVETLALNMQIDDIRLLLPSLRQAYDTVAITLAAELPVEEVERPIISAAKE